MKKTISLFLLIISPGFSYLALASETVHHDLSVILDPVKGSLAVEDFITLPEKGCQADCIFSLDKGLRLSFSDPSVKQYGAHAERVNAWSVRRGGKNRIKLKYDGAIQHDLQNISDAVGKTQHVTRGIISEQGVYLDGASHWYPTFYNEKGELPVSFSLKVTLPEGWKAISQGKRVGKLADNAWVDSSPQQEIYLIAGKYRRYQQAIGEKEALVYLHDPDDELAQRYLKVTEDYLKLYSNMLGEYPYAKFALVENFWESGYGMPSFTLLGPRVMRFPFILTSSYPHEILHNWWGNGVYVDYASGNWSEGLTSYLADHYFKAKVGKGADYRREALQKYADYVKKGDDFPLSEFHGRHGDISAAIGYSKGMMFFHMLKNRLGNDVFIKGLRRFYRDYLFKQASFDDIRQAMESVSGEKLTAFFDQWINRAGAPALQLSDAHRVPKDGGAAVTFMLTQTQSGPAYDLQIPVVVQIAGQQEPLRTVVRMTDKRQSFSISAGAPVTRLSVDPEYDVFRQLDTSEIPVSLGSFFASKQVVIVLPESESAEMKVAYQKLAKGWAASRPDRWKIVSENELASLPDDASVLLVGWENRFSEALKGALKIGRDSVEINGNKLTKADHSMMLAMANGGQVLAWLAADQVGAVPGLARKLPHYGKYSYVAFTGAAPTIGLKGDWGINASPLIADF